MHQIGAEESLLASAIGRAPCVPNHSPGDKASGDIGSNENYDSRASAQASGRVAGSGQDGQALERKEQGDWQ